MSQRLLLLSNSRDPEGGYLRWPQEHIRTFLGARVSRPLFLPYAGVTETWDVYAERVRAAFAEMSYEAYSVHGLADPVEAVQNADAIVVGGGNTFHLLTHLYRVGLLAVIRERVQSGVPYVGWSAGAVIACPTIGTTNDMPIVEPPSLNALGLIPFQINAHFTDVQPPGFKGETRSERLAEYLVVNPNRRVVALPEGTLLRVESGAVSVLGAGAARVFETGQAPRECASGEALDFPLKLGDA